MSKITLVEQSSVPAAPPAGQHILYAASDGFRERTTTEDRSISRTDVTQAEAQAGVLAGTRNFSPLRVKQAIEALQLGASGQSVFLPAPANGSRGDFNVLSIGTNGAGNLTYHILDQMATITSIRLVGIPSGGAAGSGKDIDFFSDYGAVGEAFNNHSEADSTSTFDLTGKTDELIVFDLTGILTGVQPGDFVGITIDHNAIGGAIDYLGLDVHYNLT